MEMEKVQEKHREPESICDVVGLLPESCWEPVEAEHAYIGYNDYPAIE
jgi:hypothetical protein